MLFKIEGITEQSERDAKTWFSISYEENNLLNLNIIRVFKV